MNRGWDARRGRTCVLASVVKRRAMRHCVVCEGRHAIWHIGDRLNKHAHPSPYSSVLIDAISEEEEWYLDLVFGRRDSRNFTRAEWWKWKQVMCFFSGHGVQFLLFHLVFYSKLVFWCGVPWAEAVLKASLPHLRAFLHILRRAGSAPVTCRDKSVF